jgi:hypothetical protein
LVNQEIAERKNRQLRHVLHLGKLRCDAVRENIDYKVQRGLDRSRVLSSAESHWVMSHHSIVIVGASDESGQTVTHPG